MPATPQKIQPSQRPVKADSHVLLAEIFSRCVVDSNGCWLWMGSISTAGYGHKGHRYIHRLVMETTRGPIPVRHEVCHACDVRRCVNPAHLFTGTRLDNVLDCVRKGRHGSVTHPERTLRGDNHPSHLRPETRPRGSRHGSKTHPECLAKLRGERNGNSKLTEKLVIDIRGLVANGTSRREVASALGIHYSTVARVVSGEAWGHLTEGADSRD